MQIGRVSISVWVDRRLLVFGSGKLETNHHITLLPTRNALSISVYNSSVVTHHWRRWNINIILFSIISDRAKRHCITSSSPALEAFMFHVIGRHSMRFSETLIDWFVLAQSSWNANIFDGQSRHREKAYLTNVSRHCHCRWTGWRALHWRATCNNMSVSQNGSRLNAAFTE